MASLMVNNKHLSVNELLYRNGDGEQNRARSERAASLALPHSSLLDFYDEQQEQCNSLALLPTSVNIVRRHSSHYCPPSMLDNAASATALAQRIDSSTPLATIKTATKTIATTLASASSSSSSALPPPPPSIITGTVTVRHTRPMPASVATAAAATAAVAATTTEAHVIYKNNLNPLSNMQQDETPLNTQPLSLSTYPLSSVVNRGEEECKYKANAPITPTSSNGLLEPATPPPPIPKRTFRGKYAWSTGGGGGDGGGGSVGSPAGSDTIQTPTKFKQEKGLSAAAFIYSQQNGTSVGCGGVGGGAGVGVGGGYFPSPSHGQMNGMAGGNVGGSINNGVGVSVGVGVGGVSFMDLQMRYQSAALDNGSVSDDDRMSLENSVFEESVTSTPVKLSNPPAGWKLSNSKRATRLSSSTVDSTNTSGYGSHNERCSSSSTTAEFRSRFSSVDTQSSLDSSLAEKSMSMQQQDFNCLNNNMHVQQNVSGNLTMSTNNTNTNINTNTNTNNNNTNRTVILPAVPVRKPTTNSITLATTKLQPPAYHNGVPKHNSDSEQSLNKSSSSSSNCNSQATSTVSSSTSTSSTASAISGTSTGSLLSTSTSPAAATATATFGAYQQESNQKTPVPPPPPTRHQSFTAKPMPMPSLTATRNKLNKHKPPPIVYPKLHQRIENNVPPMANGYAGSQSNAYYNVKNAVDDQHFLNASKNEIDSFDMTASHYTFMSSGNAVAPPPRKKINYRQDSTISSDSQTSSPGYNTKIMEAPLLPALSLKRLCNVPVPMVCKLQNEPIEELEQAVPRSPLTKCVPTPASLQTVVRFQNGSPNTMSLQHQVINRRKNSTLYITNGRLKFRLFQVLINAFALLAIAGGLAAYFNAYPTIKFVNKTIINTIHVEDISSFGKNPAPGTCLPIIVKFCQGGHIPYNYTVFPNYIGHFGQLETQVDLDAYEALVDVRCYELVSLFLCTLFVPKCGSTGATVPPCKTLCTETMRRCDFFFDVFGLSLPEYLNCKLFQDFESSEDCVGLDQVRDVMIASANPKCDGYQCDQNRCIPKEYLCDGHLDCMDQADESNCERCDKDEIFCGDGQCISSKHICDGKIDCPYGQDERNCIRLSERNGDLGKGVLEVYRINSKKWMPACVKNWDRAVSPTAVCSMLGYSSVNATSVITQKTHRPLLTSVNVSTDIWKSYPKRRANLMQEFSNCKPDEDYPIVELTCASFECGKVKRGRHKPSRRIIGGTKANPGSWPFLAAILGGPEKIFYCAGVLISDQWVLTASHCIGNHTVIDLEDWTIQLGVTRRNSFTYSGLQVKVRTVIPHPQYNTAIAHDNDIALFQLATRVTFQEHLLPVCLPPPNTKLKPDQLCTVIGWGKREDKDPKSTYEPIVNEVQVPIIKRTQCDEWLDNLTVSEGMICAGYEEGGKDACQGDSGGPLLCPYPNEKDRWFVGGIVSWGIMCAHPKLPGVYANVIKYVPWILEQIQKNSIAVNDEKLSKFDSHPGGPDILSNIATSPMRSHKHFQNQNRSPMDIDYYDSIEKT